MELNIRQYLCNSSNYKKNRPGEIEYIVMHYTAGSGDTAKGNASYFANASELRRSAHYFVDESAIYQSVPDEETAWHCGGSNYRHDKCRNFNSIGIEMCSDKDKSGNYYISEKTVDNAVDLVKHLVDKYSIDASHVLRHYDVTGKTCPAPWVTDSSKWAAFIDRITKEDEEMSEKEKDNVPAEWEKDSVDKAVEKGILKGSSEGDLMLHSAVTRAQLMVFLDRLGLLD